MTEKIGMSPLIEVSIKGEMWVWVLVDETGGAAGSPALGPGRTFGESARSSKVLYCATLAPETLRFSMSAMTPNFVWPQILSLSPPRSYRKPSVGPTRLFVVAEVM